MAFQTRKSVLAVMIETTEGTPVAPTSGTSFLAIQDGYSLEPNTEVLQNGEFVGGNIGQAKAILGAEAPTASFDHYLRNSGTENVAPNYAPLLKSVLGSYYAIGTEYDTVAASTVSTIKVDSGEGVNYQRGLPLLIKDSTNGYSIRPVLSVSGDDLTLGFQLPTGEAPASGVNLGKGQVYKVDDASAGNHPTLTLWDYRANEAALQMIAGARVLSMDITANAGELLNASYSFEGIAYYYDPIIITATDTKLDFNDGAVKVATIAAGFYKDPIEMAATIQNAMNAVSSGITVSYSSSTGKYTITKASGTLSLLFATGANLANSIADKIGFSATDLSAALTYTGQNPISFVAPYTPSFDSANPLVVKDNEVLLGDSSTANPSCFSTQSFTMSIANEKVDEKAICATSGKSGSVLSSRTVTIEMVANIPQYDADKYYRYRTGQNISFMYAFGTKSAGNFEAGKSGMVYLPTATISALSLDDADGLVVMNLTLTAHVENGAGEAYIGFV